MANPAISDSSLHPDALSELERFTELGGASSSSIYANQQAIVARYIGCSFFPSTKLLRLQGMYLLLRFYEL